jgi:hypothetical protein
MKSAFTNLRVERQTQFIAQVAEPQIFVIDS